MMTKTIITVNIGGTETPAQRAVTEKLFSMSDEDLAKLPPVAFTEEEAASFIPGSTMAFLASICPRK